MSAPRLRILQVMRAPVGGLFRHVADLTNALAGMGHDVGLIVDSIASDPQTEARLQALAPSAKLGIHRLPMPRLFGPADLTTPFRLRRLIAGLDVDVVHGHGAKGGFYARIARTRDNRATLYTPHGGVLHYRAGSVSGRIFHTLERALAGRTEALVFESQFAREAYAKTIGTPRHRQVVIHNGLRADEFIPVGTAADAADLVFVGELRALKGIHVLVDALFGLTRADGTPVRLVVAGSGEAAPAIERQIAERGLTGQVRLVGSQPARAAFARGQVVVVPSLAESLPYVALEAIAAGKPVIATAVGGIGEIFGPGRTALVPGDNVEALRQALQSAIDDPAALAARMVQVQAHVDAHFRAETMACAIAGLYEDILGQTHRRRRTDRYRRPASETHPGA